MLKIHKINSLAIMEKQQMNENKIGISHKLRCENLLESLYHQKAHLFCIKGLKKIIKRNRCRLQLNFCFRHTDMIHLTRYF